MQPLEKDLDGIVRFKANRIVRLLLDDGNYNMNRIALLPFTNEERMQFAQLIGYSVSGFGDLSYTDSDVADEAQRQAQELLK